MWCLGVGFRQRVWNFDRYEILLLRMVLRTGATPVHSRLAVEDVVDLGLLT